MVGAVMIWPIGSVPDWNSHPKLMITSRNRG
uniref:Uncharacterized protein n=1 Tax=Candidatus Methanogaster sp. ANME-2c ERB4 TaxID=2759911 RepID=A0A7G9YDX1_9EURY|nr:hypothetical protein ABPEKODN_00018 [Methanosarcinales archaeon ANME-2c ERB4]